MFLLLELFIERDVAFPDDVEGGWVCEVVDCSLECFDVVSQVPQHVSVAWPAEKSANPSPTVLFMLVVDAELSGLPCGSLTDEATPVLVLVDLVVLGGGDVVDSLEPPAMVVRATSLAPFAVVCGA